MRISIDCSNLQVGGGIQVALSFLHDLNKMELSEKFFVLVSPQIAEVIDKKIFKNNFDFHELSKKYYSNFIKRGIAIKKIEKEIEPNVIFTVFGPSYHKSDVPKIVGFAIPHYIYSDSPFFDLLSFKEKLKHKVYKLIRTYYFKKNSDQLIFETKDARDKFCAKYNYKIKDTNVVSNTLNQIFLTKEKWRNIKFQSNSTKRILCLAANYKHKNLNIIPRVIDFLVKDYKIKNFQFVISQTKEQLPFPEEYNEYIEYLGKVSLEQIPSLYQSVDILFMPTLLEVFSTTYLEAMFMKVPIVTTNLSFAKDVCADAASYFEPLNSKDAAQKINEVLSDTVLQDTLIQAGILNLRRFGASSDRTKKYIEILTSAAISGVSS